MAETLKPVDASKAVGRFGIQEMFIFVAVVALSLACSFPDSTIPGQPNPQSFTWKLVFGLSEMTSGILGLGGAALVIRSWIREGKFPADPGCLLFLICAASFLLGNAVATIFGMFLDAANSSTQEVEMGYVIGLSYVRLMTPAVLFLVCLRGLVRDRWWWRLSFASLAISQIFSMTPVICTLTYAMQSSPVNATYLRNVTIMAALISFLSVVFVVIAGVIDLVCRVSRSWTHWSGVICFLIFSTLPSIVMIVATRVLPLKELYGLP
ncbi:hypothetical protein [Mariniblastus fucicola]|uniref:Uncharacterized protein n=1 Tax=Mariniblastus fucicola TaxID=980251 RepID=A0A5B9PDD9_9BACT|nr:hypothetical protein [Mariniblastus fucicola]QEG22586.1 hypothetical protein MFFC18_24690 [Mariniblastus fucicola]